jgi:hypothetical protein
LYYKRAWKNQALLILDLLTNDTASLDTLNDLTLQEHKGNNDGQSNEDCGCATDSISIRYPTCR